MSKPPTGAEGPPLLSLSDLASAICDPWIAVCSARDRTDTNSISNKALVNRVVGIILAFRLSGPVGTRTFPNEPPGPRRTKGSDVLSLLGPSPYGRPLIHPTIRWTNRFRKSVFGNLPPTNSLFGRKHNNVSFGCVISSIMWIISSCTPNENQLLPCCHPKIYPISYRIALILSGDTDQGYYRSA